MIDFSHKNFKIYDFVFECNNYHPWECTQYWHICDCPQTVSTIKITNESDIDTSNSVENILKLFVNKQDNYDNPYCYLLQCVKDKNVWNIIINYLY